MLADFRVVFSRRLAGDAETLGAFGMRNSFNSTGEVRGR
jgi:hypothetical protein